jgi:hypothetical protein
MVVPAPLVARACPRRFGGAGSKRKGAAGFGLLFGIRAGSRAALLAGAKYRMTPVPDFLRLETARPTRPSAVVSPLIARPGVERAGRDWPAQRPDGRTRAVRVGGVPMPASL